MFCLCSLDVSHTSEGAGNTWSSIWTWNHFNNHHKFCTTCLIFLVIDWFTHIRMHSKMYWCRSNRNGVPCINNTSILKINKAWCLKFRTSQNSFDLRKMSNQMKTTPVLHNRNISWNRFLKKVKNCSNIFLIQATKEKLKMELYSMEEEKVSGLTNFIDKRKNYNYVFQKLYYNYVC